MNNSQPHIGKNRQTAEDRCTVLLFCLFLGCMTIFSGLNCLRHSNSESISITENRKLADFPTLNSGFFSGFSQYFNDHLAFREELIHWLNASRYYSFGISPSPKVLAGKNGWLYFLDEGDKENLRHFPLLQPTELNNWVRNFETKQKWLAQRNIRYLLVLAPSKCEIEREAVPDQYQYKNELSNQDLLIAVLRKNNLVDILDLRPTMREFKRKNPNLGPLYLKTDTHWNALGGFLGYQCMAGHLTKIYGNQLIKPMSLADFKLSHKNFTDGDLAKMMGLTPFLQEKIPKLESRSPYLWHYGKERERPLSNQTRRQPQEYNKAFATERDGTECGAPKHGAVKCDVAEQKPLKELTLARLKIESETAQRLPSAVFIRDSFLRAPQPMLSQHFRRAYFFWSREFPFELIEDEKPDIVIEEFVERNLALPVPEI